MKKKKQIKKNEMNIFSQIEPGRLNKAFKVSVDNVKFLSAKGRNTKQRLEEFDLITEKMENFLRTLEKKFHQVIWYIGTDVLDDEIVERFLFQKAGFMEIIIKQKTEIKAYLPVKKQAKKLIRALRKTSKKFPGLGRIHYG